jgi:hypothetical protein
MDSSRFCGLNEVFLVEINVPNKKGENPRKEIILHPWRYV